MLALLLTLQTLSCGGGFGADIVVDPDQSIVVGYAGGVETYVFQPYFCGASNELGIVLPVPAALSQSPRIGDAALTVELERLTRPALRRECRASGVGCGGSRGALGVDGGERGGNFDPGVDVVDAGHVGIFDWVLLQADTRQAFTDWLDANAFPYDEGSADAFDFYVQRSWHFVAFKVTSGAAAPPAGQKLCGVLGPIVLSFPAAAPVVPARIAAVNTTSSGAGVWRVFVLGEEEYWPRDVGQLMLFSGSLAEVDLADSPALRAFAAPAARVSKSNIYLPYGGPEDDIYFVAAPTPTDYRIELTEYEECGCAASSGDLLPALLVLLALGAGTQLLRHWPRAPSQRSRQTR